MDTGMQKVKVKDQSVQKIEWKETNRQTGGRTDPIALRSVLARSVIIRIYLHVQLDQSFSCTAITFQAVGCMPTERRLDSQIKFL